MWNMWLQIITMTCHWFMWSVICWMFAITHPVRFPLLCTALHFNKGRLWWYFQGLKYHEVLFFRKCSEKTFKCLYKLLCPCNTTQDTSENMDMDLFKTVHCTVHLRGQIDTNCTWSQHQLSCSQVLQIAELIDCFYNKHTSFTVCSVSGIKIELASPSPSLLQSSPQPANTFPLSTTVIPGSPH